MISKICGIGSRRVSVCVCSSQVGDSKTSYFAPVREQSNYVMGMSISLSERVHTYLGNHTAKLSVHVSDGRAWALGPPLAALRYALPVLRMTSRLRSAHSGRRQ